MTSSGGWTPHPAGSNSLRMRRALLLPAAALVLACAGAPSGAPDACPAAWDHAEGVLRAGLARYVRGMDAYVAAAAPGSSTAAAQARAAAAADAWSAQHREPFLAACRAAPPERTRCLLAAEAAPDLTACGEGDLVQSFSDEVLPAFSAGKLAG